MTTIAPNTLDRDQELEIYRQLQKNLNVMDLLRNLQHLIQKFIPCHSIQYENASQALNFHYNPLQLAVLPFHYQISLTHQNQPLGTLTFGHTLPFTRGAKQMLNAISNCFLNPLKHALAYSKALQSSLTDHLTGLGNRAAFDHSLAQEIRYTKRCDQPLCLLLIDLDYLKNINDQYGHPTGDSALQKLALILNKIVRDSDLVFRYGGDEFAILLRNTDLAGTNLLAERLYEQLKKPIALEANLTLTLKASMGSAQFEYYETATQLLTRADQALYQAKRQGRNQLVAHKIEEMHSHAERGNEHLE